MGSPAVFYFPQLIREHVPAPAAAFAAFIQAGLEDAPCSSPGGETPGVCEAEALFRAGLPLKPAAARHVLAEMLRLGGEHGATGTLLDNLFFDRLPGRLEMLRHEEQEALRLFSESGSLSAYEKGGDGTALATTSSEAPEGGVVLPEKLLVDCQKILLLAYDLERRRTEIRRLHEHALHVEERLMHALHGGQGDELVDSFRGRAGALAEGATDEVPWRAVFEAALVFLPEHAVFYTADKDVVDALENSGLLAPAPEDALKRCPGLPEELLERLFYANRPAWEITGRRSLPPGRPWLARRLEIFAVRGQKLFGERS